MESLVLRMAAATVLGCLMVAVAADDSAEPVVRPVAKVQTAPVPHDGDAADDPAIWVHPTEPEKSLLLGTDKQGGLHVYDLDGAERGLVSDGCRPNNVDVLYDFPLGGRKVDLAVASCRGAKAKGVKVWLIDPESRSLRDVTAGGVLAVLDRGEPYGICTYHSRKTDLCFFFVNDKNGHVEQYRLEEAGDGTVKAIRVRTLKLTSIVEGCVADDEAGWFYIAEENVGIWKFGAEPDAGAQGRLIDQVGRHGLTADVEGLTIYGAADGKGYLIASSQGNNTFKVYERQGDNRFVLTIDPAQKPGGIDDVSDTDGIAVTNRPLSRAFPRGGLVVQDGHNAAGHQNFKLYAWEDIAGQRLIIDTQWSPRR